jgi:hypothetical protein
MPLRESLLITFDSLSLDFQLMGSPKVRNCLPVLRFSTVKLIFQAFRAELPSWRAVIQLNVVRSVRMIVDTITIAHQAGEGYPPLGPEQLKLKMKLTPLLRIEDALIEKLAPNSQHHQGRIDGPCLQ